MVDRDNYDWTMLAKDLALVTELTLMEAGELVMGFQLCNDPMLHPYDLLMPLRDVVKGGWQERGRALLDLVKLGQSL